jgi:hypothetical protein
MIEPVVQNPTSNLTNTLASRGIKRSASEAKLDCPLATKAPAERTRPVGPNADKISGLIDNLTTPPEARQELTGLLSRMTELQAQIKDGKVTPAEIIQATNAIPPAMSAIGARYPELASALNAAAGAGVREAAIRQQRAPEWGVDPLTGKFIPGGKIADLTPAQIQARATAPPQLEDADIVRRWRRHVQERAAEKKDPMAFDKWAASGFTANVNREASNPYEAAAIEALGGTPNNAAGQGLSWPTTERVDANGRRVEPDAPGGRDRTETTRPDGTRPNQNGGLDIIEHKHLTGKTEVYDDSHQLRAQRAMSVEYQGKHELVLSSDRPLTSPGGTPPVKPSGPLGKSDSEIYYYDSGSGRVTHTFDGTRGKWRPFRGAPGTT